MNAKTTALLASYARSFLAAALSAFIATGGDIFSLDKEGFQAVIGAGIVGPSAGDLIGEAALAIEMSCDAEDIGLTIHPHPTLSETVAMAAEMYAGTITDLYLPRKKG